MYYPKSSALNSGTYCFQIALLLQGALLDKSFYSDYASLVARYGLVVVVPNNLRPSPFNPTSPPNLVSQTSQIAPVLSQMAIENTKPTSPIAFVVDTQRLGLLGHSFGGAVGYRDYIYYQGDALDPNLRVTTVAVPEPSSNPPSAL
ncbi:hypothetical protein QUB30_32910 [Microcoleus sp. BROC3]